MSPNRQFVESFRVCLLGLLMTWCLPAGSAESPLLGELAPDFTLPALKGFNVRLSEHLGQVIVVNFWMTACQPCRRQMLRLKTLNSRYGTDGLLIFGVSLDRDDARAAATVRALDVNYPTLFDPDKNVRRSYQVDTMPVTVLIDREGRVRSVFSIFRPGDEERLAEEVRRLLNE